MGYSEFSSFAGGMFYKVVMIAELTNPEPLLLGGTQG